MRMAELSEASGVPVATIKYYRRAGLLHEGSRSAPNQASYDESHLSRLRLIRALREVADLPVAAIGEVLAAVDDPSLPLLHAVGAAHAALAGPQDPPDDRATAEAKAAIDRAGWQVSDGAPARAELAHALRALRALGSPAGPAEITRYITAADRLAQEETASAMDPAAPRDQVVTQVVIGTVVYERVLTAMRRLAQEHHAGQATAG